MKISKHQWIAILVACLLVIGLYFGFDIRNKDIKRAEEARIGNMSITSIQNIQRDVFDSLSPQVKSTYDALHLQLEEQTYEEDRMEIKKLISGFWFKQGEFAMAGQEAVDIATYENTAQSWSIAGTTFAKGIKEGKNQVRKQYNFEQAIEAFEKAFSLEPSNISHKTNLAVCYAEMPPKDNPMKGVMMLLDLDKQYPENIGVQFQLARFGFETGQYEKAEGRLKKILSLEPNYRKAHCLLSILYHKIGKTMEAEQHRKRCEL